MGIAGRYCAAAAAAGTGAVVVAAVASADAALANSKGYARLEPETFMCEWCRHRTSSQ